MGRAGDEATWEAGVWPDGSRGQMGVQVEPDRTRGQRGGLGWGQMRVAARLGG